MNHVVRRVAPPVLLALVADVQRLVALEPGLALEVLFALGALELPLQVDAERRVAHAGRARWAAHDGGIAAAKPAGYDPGKAVTNRQKRPRRSASTWIEVRFRS